MTKFRDLLHSSLKSEDTEEWLDVHFTRPIGLAMALLAKRLGITPNMITLFSIAVGCLSGWCFFHEDTLYNIYGIALLMLANFCDSADGQLARLTGNKTLIGRMLDGFAGDAWFFCIYFGLCCRLMHERIPYTEYSWGFWIWVLAYIASIMCHSPQSSLSDYYRQIHLFFLKGREASELASASKQRVIYNHLPKEAYLQRAFYYNYSAYCRSQERRTPRFQHFMVLLRRRKYLDTGIPEDLRQEFLAGSRPLMKHTNLLTFNLRAITLYVTCLLNCPWVYMLVEITIMNLIYIDMHKRHEALCLRLSKKIDETGNTI